MAAGETVEPVPPWSLSGGIPRANAHGVYADRKLSRHGMGPCWVRFCAACQQRPTPAAERRVHRPLFRRSKACCRAKSDQRSRVTIATPFIVSG